MPDSRYQYTDGLSCNTHCQFKILFAVSAMNMIATTGSLIQTEYSSFY